MTAVAMLAVASYVHPARATFEMTKRTEGAVVFVLTEQRPSVPVTQDNVPPLPGPEPPFAAIVTVPVSRANVAVAPATE